MATGYEVKMYHDIEGIRRALERKPHWVHKHLEVDREYEFNTTNGGRVEGTLVAIDDEVLIVRPDKVGQTGFKTHRQPADRIVVIAQIANVVPKQFKLVENT